MWSLKINEWHVLSFSGFGGSVNKLNQHKNSERKGDLRMILNLDTTDIVFIFKIKSSIQASHSLLGTSFQRSDFQDVEK